MACPPAAELALLVVVFAAVGGRKGSGDTREMKAAEALQASRRDLRDYVCPDPFDVEVMLFVPRGGWHIGDCVLELRQGGIILPPKPTRQGFGFPGEALVFVEAGRRLELRGSIAVASQYPRSVDEEMEGSLTRRRPAMLSELPPECAQGVLAPGATVVIAGDVSFSGLCTPDSKSIREGPLWHPKSFPQGFGSKAWVRLYDDGAALNAEHVKVLDGSRVEFAYTFSRLGSGGAIKAALMEVEGSANLTFRNTAALRSAGAIHINAAAAEMHRHLRASWHSPKEIDLVDVVAGTDGQTVFAAYGALGVVKRYDVTSGLDQERTIWFQGLDHTSRVATLDDLLVAMSAKSCDALHVVNITEDKNHVHRVYFGEAPEPRSGDAEFGVTDRMRGDAQHCEQVDLGFVSKDGHRFAVALSRTRSRCSLYGVRVDSLVGDAEPSLVLYRGPEVRGDAMECSTSLGTSNHRGEFFVGMGGQWYLVRVEDGWLAAYSSPQGFGSSAVALSPDSRALTVAGRDSAEVMAFAVDDRREEGQSPFEKRDHDIAMWGMLHDMSFSPDGAYLALLYKDWTADTHTVQVVDTQAWERVISFGVRNALRRLSWSPSGRTLVTGSKDGAVFVFDVGALGARSGSALTKAGLYTDPGSRMQVINAAALEERGGAIHVDGNLRLYGAELRLNWAGLSGGALYARGGDVHLERVTFKDNDCATGANNAVISNSGRRLSLRSLSLSDSASLAIFAPSGSGEELARWSQESWDMLGDDWKLQADKFACTYPGHYLHAVAHEAPEGVEVREVAIRCTACPRGTAFSPASGCCEACPRGWDCRSAGADLSADVAKAALPFVVAVRVEDSRTCDPAHKAPAACLWTAPASFAEMALRRGWPNIFRAPSADGLERDVCWTTKCAVPGLVMTDDLGCRTCEQLHGPGWSTLGGTYEHCVRDVPELLIEGSVQRAHEHVEVTVLTNLSGTVSCTAAARRRVGILAFLSTFKEQRLAGQRYWPGGREIVALRPVDLELHLLHSTLFVGSCTFSAPGLDAAASFEIATGTSFRAWSAEEHLAIDVVCGALAVAVVVLAICSRGRLRSSGAIAVLVAAALTLAMGIILGVFALALPGQSGRSCALRLLQALIALSAIGLHRAWVAHRQRDRFVDGRLREAIVMARELQYPLVIMEALDFLSIEGLIPHEDARERGLLQFFDCASQTRSFFAEGTGRCGIFFSHQWLSWADPDPDGLQFRSMCAALRQLGSCRSQSAGGVGDLHVWVDYFSIPQLNRHTQRLAIHSLPVYTSLLQTFVIVVPPVYHADTAQLCDMASYQRRGWCRAEQLSFRLRHGPDNMFYIGNRKLRPFHEGDMVTALTTMREGHEIGMVDTESLTTGVPGTPDFAMMAARARMWSLASSDVDGEDVAEADCLSKAFHVFSSSSEFSCCAKEHTGADGRRAPCDRHALMLPMLGLYAGVYESRSDPTMQLLWAWISAHGSEIFPSTIQVMTREGVQREKLFGRLVPAITEKITAEADHGGRASSFFGSLRRALDPPCENDFGKADSLGFLPFGRAERELSSQSGPRRSSEKAENFGSADLAQCASSVQAGSFGSGDLAQSVSNEHLGSFGSAVLEQFPSWSPSSLEKGHQ